MQSAMNSTRQAVFTAYADAVERADRLLQSVISDIGTVLDDAKCALSQAQNNELKVLSDNYDRAYREACRSHEQATRKAGYEHGTSMTAAVGRLEEERKAIEARREGSLAFLRAQYEAACAEAGNKDDPSCLPFLDALKVAEARADSLAEFAREDAYRVYMLEKEREDQRLAQTLETLQIEKQEALSVAQTTFEEEKRKLLNPLEETLNSAQERFDRALKDARDHYVSSCALRFAIFEDFNRGLRNAMQARLALESLE